jgi:hypothetical protein
MKSQTWRIRYKRTKSLVIGAVDKKRPAPPKPESQRGK